MTPSYFDLLEDPCGDKFLEAECSDSEAVLLVLSLTLLYRVFEMLMVVSDS
jgi:hypothetical protein